MRKIAVLFLLFCASCASQSPKPSPASNPTESNRVPASASTAVTRFVEEVSGEYRLETNDPKNECLGFASGLNKDDHFRITSQVRQQDDQFGEAGALSVFFQMYYPTWTSDDGQNGKWYRVFDRSDFLNIDEGSSRKITVMGIISHRSIVDLKERKIVNTVGQSIPLYGKSAAIQEMAFDVAKGRMTYSYSISDYNGLGKNTGSLPAGRCVFYKVK